VDFPPSFSDHLKNARVPHPSQFHREGWDVGSIGLLLLSLSEPLSSNPETVSS
jgi:hypothetical protein